MTPAQIRSAVYCDAIRNSVATGNGPSGYHRSALAGGVPLAPCHPTPWARNRREMMGEAAFTKGPWSVHEGHDWSATIKASDYSLIAVVGNMGATSDHKPAAKRWRLESSANATLIAASPALYEALRRLNDACWTADNKGDLADDVDGELLAAADAALALARGETP